jgi:hypothetical protein
MQFSRRNLGPLLLAMALGLIVAAGVVLVMTLARPIFSALALAGLIIFLPTLILKDVKRYWFTLFIVSFLFDNVSKRTTSWLVDPIELGAKFGIPPNGNLSIHLHLSDLILIAMMIPWLLRVLTHRQRLYFPAIGYLAMGYLLWALFASLTRSVSLTLTMFELFHQTVYFVMYLFVVNNIDRRGMVKAVIQGCLAALVLESIVIIVTFSSQSFAFFGGGVYDIDASQQTSEEYRTETKAGDTLIVRSRGTFNHPAAAAAFLHFLLPLSLMLAIARPRPTQKLLYGSLFALGVVALILTFSRSAFLGALFSIAICFWMARRTNLFGRRKFHALVTLTLIALLAASPLIWDFLERRPEAFKYRFILLAGGVELVLQRPVLGVGLANSNHATREFWERRGEAAERGGIVIHNAYLLLAVEIGLLGAALYLAFFVLAGRNAFRASRSTDPDEQVLAIAILASILGLALHMAADPFGGNVLHSMLWIFAGVATALARREASQHGQNHAPVGTHAVTTVLESKNPRSGDGPRDSSGPLSSEREP